MASYLFLKELAARHSFLKGSVTANFAELFDEIEDVVTTYDCIKDNELKRSFLQHVRNFLPDWADVYVRLFPYCLNATMLDTLVDSGHEDKLRKMVLDIIENYRDHREAFIWVVKNLRETRLVQAARAVLREDPHHACPHPRHLLQGDREPP